MIIAMIALTYMSIGVLFALICGEENRYTAAACGLIWLPCLVWYVVKKAWRV